MSTPTPKAYRYARFSHSRQAEGMSLERQADVAVEWARQKGIELDDTLAAFVDAGVSASRGKNIVKGALGRFREAVAAGDVAPGSYLLVESVSRFSRLSPLDSQPVLRELVEAGIRVVFFDPSIEVNADNQHDMQVGMIFQIMAYIAKEYADTLGRYKTKAWERARDAMRTNGKSATALLPYWLTCERGIENGRPTRGPITLHPVYAPIVERIFREYLAGHGKAQIAARLNAEKIAPPMRVGSKEGKRAAFWRHGLIGRTLSNPAVTGVFQPHKEIKTRITLKSGIAGALKRKREPAGEPIPDYYPRVISDELFAQVATVREQNCAKAGAKINSPGRGPKGRERVYGEVAHLLARLACCPVCGAAMKRSNKGASSRSEPKYICTRAISGKSGACKRVYVPVADVENALIAAADTLRDAPNADPAMSAQVRELEERHGKTAARLAALTDSLAGMIERGEPISSFLNAQHTKLESERDALAAELATLRGKATAAQPNVIKNRVAHMVDALKAHGPGPLDMNTSGVNAALYECFARAVIDYRSGELVMHWRHGPPPAVIKYA